MLSDIVCDETRGGEARKVSASFVAITIIPKNLHLHSVIILNLMLLVSLHSLLSFCSPTHAKRLSLVFMLIEIYFIVSLHRL